MTEQNGQPVELSLEDQITLEIELIAASDAAKTQEGGGGALLSVPRSWIRSRRQARPGRTKAKGSTCGADGES